MDVKELANVLKNFEDVDCSELDCDKCPIGEDICEKLFDLGDEVKERDEKLNPLIPEELIDFSDKLIDFPNISCAGTHCDFCPIGKDVCQKLLCIKDDLIKRKKELQNE